MLYLTDVYPNGLPRRIDSSSCHCHWQADDGAMPRDQQRSLMGFLRDHLWQFDGRMECQAGRFGLQHPLPASAAEIGAAALASWR